MNPFIARTQYNDFRGTAAADRSDILALGELLPLGESLKDKEIVIGFSFGFNENNGSKVEPGVCLHIGVRDGDQIVSTRDVEISLNGKKMADVFAHLKRFKMVVTIDGMTPVER